MTTNCYICDDCYELFEPRASMAKSDAYSKDHRVRCPNCASEHTRCTEAAPHPPPDSEGRKSKGGRGVPSADSR